MEILKRGNDPDIIVAIGDTHTGHNFAACPPRGFTHQSGSITLPNDIQKAINDSKAKFEEKVELYTKGKTYGVTHCGDWLEGDHHRAKDLSSLILSDQAANCAETWGKLVAGGEWIRTCMGSSPHDGPQGEWVEQMLKDFGVEPCPFTGRYSRPINVFRWHDLIVHLAHHIPTTQRAHTRATGPWGELNDQITSAGELGTRPADIVLRGHRHVEHFTGAGSPHGARYGIVTPPWSYKNDFAAKTPGGRNGVARVGGFIIEKLKDGRVCVWPETYYITMDFLMEEDGNE